VLMVNLDVCICSSRLACQVKHRLFLLIYFVRGTLESYSIPVVFTMLPNALRLFSCLVKISAGPFLLILF